MMRDNKVKFGHNLLILTRVIIWDFNCKKSSPMTLAFDLLILKSTGVFKTGFFMQKRIRGQMLTTLTSVLDITPFDPKIEVLIE